MSVTATVNVRVAELTCASLVVHVTGVAPTANVDPDAGEQTTGRAPSTISTADAVNVTSAPTKLVARVLTFAGVVRTGGVVSTTVTVSEAALWLAWASIAVHVIAVVPNGKIDPDTGTHSTGVGPSTVSFDEALKLTAAPLDDVASVATLADAVTTGGVVSTTATENDPDP